MIENPSNYPQSLHEIPFGEYCEKLLGGVSPDGIAVLGGAFIKQTASRYQTSPFLTDGRIGGVQERGTAAAALGRVFDKALVITLSHTQRGILKPQHLALGYVEDQPCADVMAREVIDLGIPSERVVRRPASTTTLTEVMEVLHVADEHNLTNFIICTNGYQIDRAKAITEMLFAPSRREWLRESVQNSLPDDVASLFGLQLENLGAVVDRFSERGGLVGFLAVESLFLHDSEHSAQVIHAMNTPAWEEREKRDSEGARQIREGTYNFSQGIAEYLQYPHIR